MKHQWSNTVDILEGIEKAIKPAFRKHISDVANPYGTGDAAEVIIEHLSSVELGDRIISKRFHDLDGPCQAERGRNQ